jgi:hypothetical protein
MQTSQDRPRSDSPRDRRLIWVRRPTRYALLNSLVWPDAIEVADILLHHSVQMSLTQEDEVVQTVLATLLIQASLTGDTHIRIHLLGTRMDEPSSQHSLVEGATQGRARDRAGGGSGLAWCSSTRWGSRLWSRQWIRRGRETWWGRSSTWWKWLVRGKGQRKNRPGEVMGDLTCFQKCSRIRLQETTGYGCAWFHVP